MTESARNSTGNSQPVWDDLTKADRHPSLQDDATADVCIIGGGITGLTCALLLADAGKSVILLEDGRLGSGDTGRTSAHLSNALDDRFEHLEHVHGEKGARLAAQSHTRAIDEIETLVRVHRIDCDFERVDGYLFPGPDESADFLERELAAAHRAGLKAVERLDAPDLAGFRPGPCLRFPEQAQFEPVRYLVGLAAAAERAGARIHENTHVEEVEGGTAVRVAAANGSTVRARSAIVATNAPLTGGIRFPLKQFAYRTYIATLRVEPGAVTRALYWDSADPYHFVRLHTSGRDELLIVGGEDHKVGQPGSEDPGDRYHRLEHWARERFAGLGPVVSVWSGQILEPADGLAYIGRFPAAGENIYLATGDSGHGLTHGTIAGLLIRDLIRGRSNPWEALYDPTRVTLRSAATLVRENLNVLPQYGKWLTRGEVTDLREIPPGEGRVVRRGLRKYACYRDEQGDLRRFSAVCPHLGGILVWNSGEKTWDCPCHGSRFSAVGKVVNGPANVDLEPVAVRSRRRRPSKTHH